MMTLRILVLATAVFCPGCSPDTLATLSGSVTFNGAPLKKGTLTLEPLGAGGTTAGAEIRDGQYKLSNLKPGKYRATIAAEFDGPVILPNSPEAKRPATPAEIARWANPLPADAQGNNIEVEVKAGEQKLDFPLTGKAG